MEQCQHINGFTVDSYTFPSIGKAYIVRCRECNTAIGVTTQDYGHEIHSLESDVRSIQHAVNSLK